MSPKHYLIIGNGLVSQTLAPFLEAKHCQVTVVDFPEIDITSKQSVADTIAAHHPDYVINAAAYTNTHAAEQDATEADTCFRCNVQGPINILSACATLDTPWLHISTGMMFDGTPPQPDGWRETDTPTLSSWYVKTKYWADSLLLPEATDRRILITRIHTPIGTIDHPKNLLKKLAGFSSGVTDAASFTVLEDYCKAVYHLITTEQTGLFHVTNPETISFIGIMDIMKEVGLMDPSKIIEQQSMQELNANRGTKAYQPVSILSSQKLAATGITLPSISDRIRNLLA